MKTVSESDEREQAQFLFDPEEIARSDEPPEDAARLVWMVLSLVRGREIAYERYSREFHRAERTFSRDIAKLRELARDFEFELGPRKNGRVALVRIAGERVADGPRAQTEAAKDALRAMVDALGAVVERQIAPYVDVAGAPSDRFLRVATPRLIAHTAVADIYDTLRDAWRRRAMVRFRYPPPGGGRLIERIVEPYLVTYVAGRYYLVAFDIRPRSGGWRQYALDRIGGTIARAGTYRRRPIPPAYRGEDAVGLFKTEGPIEVTIRLSPRIAAAVSARRWQAAQRCEASADGSALLVFEVYDVGEAVRWSLGFGTEAHVVAPPAAVARAAAMAREVADAYGNRTGADGGYADAHESAERLAQ